MRRSLIALALAVVLPWPAIAAEVTVKPGETLSDIAARHGLSVARLMKLNGISNPNHVEAGSRLTIPGASGGSVTRAKLTGSSASSATVIVGEGETLSGIADRHGMSVSRLIELNGLSNPNHVEAGTRLKVSSRAAAASGGSSFSYDRKASSHVVRRGESLSRIADGYGVPMSKLVAINEISDPNHVEVGTKLRLKGNPAAATTPSPAPRPTASVPAKPVSTARATSGTPAVQPKPVAGTAAVSRPATKVATASRPAVTAATTAGAAEAASAKPSWRTYGPLQVDWANWQPMGGSMVAPTLNSQGQSLYLAINCSARKLNATGQAGEWKTWDDPRSDFEIKLVNDLCRSRTT